MIIYKAENKINGKVYIGSTTRTLGIRKSQHKQESKTRKNKFYSAILKHGFDNFEWSIIDKAKTFDELQKKEILHINKYDSVKKGYNICYGGQGHNTKNDIYTDKECLKCKHYYDCNEIMSDLCKDIFRSIFSEEPYRIYFEEIKEDK